MPKPRFQWYCISTTSHHFRITVQGVMQHWQSSPHQQPLLGGPLLGIVLADAGLAGLALAGLALAGSALKDAPLTGAPLTDAPLSLGVVFDVVEPPGMFAV